MSVFADTSAILAILDSDDSKHSQASATWLTIVQSDEEIITSNYIVLETFSLLHSRFGAASARRFSDYVVPAMQIKWVDNTIHDKATSAALGSAGKSGPSLVDCASFEIVRQWGIDRVFAYDKHFRSRGYQLIG